MSDAPIIFKVPSRGPAAEGRIEATTRSTAELVELRAVPGEDVVELELVNGPTLTLHPLHVKELLAAQHGASRSEQETSDAVVVPTQLGWSSRGADATRSRGLSEVGQVVLHAFRVIKDTVASKGANLLTNVIATGFDGRAAPGLWPLQSKPVAPDPGAPIHFTGRAILVLLHGTFSTTLESFGGLWKQAGLIDSLRQRFDAYAFDHPTLMKSPLENALELVEQLPQGAKVTFLTHSRGGLIAEAISHLADGKALTATAEAIFQQEEKYRAELQQLRALQAKVAERGIQVDRIVRVACPTRGTLLASARLDVYLSVLKWGLQLAQIPVAPQLVALLHEIAKRRARPDELPGIEAMMPESAFVRWLNHSDQIVSGQLRVVAGDMQGDSLASWLKTLVSDAYFWTDNDLVVQTRSMYGGRPRTEGSASYFLDRGGKVSHFGYFSNSTTAQAVSRALTEDAPEGFKVIGKLSQAGLSSSGSRGHVKGDLGASKAKPAVILLPGILGSELSKGEDLIWLSLRIVNGLPRLAVSAADNVSATGWLGLVYDGVAEYLSTTHEVIPFWFDWRRPIEEQAKKLAQVLERAREGRAAPVRILAHSHGGLVARALELEAPALWNAWMADTRSRLVMLGTPNAGSWAPMQVLSGDNLIGALVTYVGTLFDESKARALFAALPGFLQLQAGMLDKELELFKADTWKKLAKTDAERWGFATLWHHLGIQREVLHWGIPDQEVLDGARSFRQRLALQDLRPLGDRVVMVVGNADETPAGFEAKNGRFEYLQTSHGDGTVTLADALIPGVKAFQVDVEHSRLPMRDELFAGFFNLLEHGTPHDARHFTGLTASTRGGSAPAAFETDLPRRAPRRRGWDDAELDLTGVSLDAVGPSDDPSRAVAPALKISVTHGDLTFVNQPLLLGHYRSLKLAGAEKKIDEFLGGTMTLALRLRGYATQINESRYFKNQRPNPDDAHQVPRPPAVVVVGLGAEGELRAEELTSTVRQGVINHAVKLAGEQAHGTSFELAATLIGSGGLGIAVATSARAIAQGVYAANQRLLEQGAPIVAKLEIIELYEDRATEALRELGDFAVQLPSAFQVERWLKVGRAGLIRPLTSGYRGADYDMVSVLEGAEQEGVKNTVFALDSRRARAEVRSTTTQLPLLQALIDEAEADRRRDSQLGKTLFRLLVPAALDSFFGGADGVLLQLDGTTAAVPWELLSVDSDQDEASDKPWAVRAKLVRKLQTRDFREQPLSAGQEAKVLVIGDPHIDDRAQYPALAGAIREARAVATALDVQPGPLLQARAVDLVKALLAEDLSILHVAGHGREDGAGVVMSGNLVLGADIVKSMRRLPDLVFVNTCHSGRERVGKLPGRAATLARALIEVGVRCVIATGWAVDDDAAEHFALEFYASLQRRNTFMNATAEARDSTHQKYPHSNTWAAYQCYGDPDWVWSRRAPEATDKKTKADAPPTNREPESLIVSASGLLVTLHALANVGREEKPRALERLRQLEIEMGPQYGDRGDVAEAFAVAFHKVGDREDAIRWYELATRTEKGATFASLEQLFNLRVRSSADRVEKALRDWEDNPPDEAIVTGLKASIQRAITDFEEQKSALDLLARLPDTSERLSMIASSWKRRAMAEYAKLAALDDQTALPSLLDALRESQIFYEKAAKVLSSKDKKSAAYPQLNAMTVQLVRELVTGDSLTDDTKATAEVRASLDAWTADKREFWPFAQEVEVDVYLAVLRQSLAKDLPQLEKRFEDLWSRIADVGNWGSVAAQARFLLRPYQRRSETTESERDAAKRLLRVLHGYSRGSG